MADARHILVVDEWPEDYSDPELPIVADKIMQEWEKLSGTNAFYTKKIKALMSINRDKLRVRALNLISLAKRINILLADQELFEFCNDIKSQFKFHDSDISTFENISRKQTQIINKINNRLGQIQYNKSDPEYLNFEDLIAEIEDKLPNVKCDFDITIALYEAFRRRIKLRKN